MSFTKHIGYSDELGNEYKLEYRFNYTDSGFDLKEWNAFDAKGTLVNIPSADVSHKIELLLEEELELEYEANWQDYLYYEHANIEDARWYAWDDAIMSNVGEE